MKAQNIKGIYEISGFGKKTPYEKHCQSMLQAGYDWLVEHKKKAKLKAETLKGVYGLFEPKSPEAKELSKAITKNHSDCSGAQHHAVMGHLFYINNNGIEKWKEEVTKK